MTGKLRILVLGYVVRCPLGGMAWHYAQYAKGLLELGHDVYFLEDSEDHEWSCYNPHTHEQNTDPAYGLQFARQLFDRLGLDQRWAYYDAHTSTWMGPCGSDAVSIAATADVLLNVSGANPIRPWLEQVPCRAFIDTDPAFEQVRQLTVSRRAERAAAHTAFFTFGENFGATGCGIPDDGLAWQPTRQPIVIDQWPVVPSGADAPFTSVMQWDSYETREYRGVKYGMKSMSFGEFLDLPQQCDAKLELALGSRGAPRDELRAHGWILRDPLAATLDPWRYRRFIQDSGGEFSVAKHGYVVSHSGWFSERSAAYLASGRPVIAQNTGFVDWMDTGAGIWAVSSIAEAAAALDAVRSDYDAECAAARNVAAAYFDSRRVLTRLLEKAG